ncbi:MAG: alanyl-tRNA editing protein, partial [Chloroflexi bacterium]|nr:alanyl-tRNA editing protein [Chloroflexota bacterium]
MAVRLYRDDSFLWHFSAHVCERVLHDGRPAVVLDRTAFYPTSGGQPFDFGSLNGVPVLEVIERDDGEIVHVLGATLEADEAQGEIDGARRIDHMQQHSGQHVLSGAFVTTANLDTLAVHIGAEECTIDLPATRLPPAALERAEDEANRIVFEDRPVIVRELSDAEAAALPLRKPPRVSGRIRIVEIEGFDWSACGGTHVRSSAQIGVIKSTRAE